MFSKPANNNQKRSHFLILKKTHFFPHYYLFIVMIINLYDFLSTTLNTSVAKNKTVIAESSGNLTARFTTKTAFFAAM